MVYAGRLRSGLKLLSTVDGSSIHEAKGKRNKLEIYENRNIVDHSTTRKRMKRCIPSLPEEIIFNILVWLPADILYNVMRYVCREWYKIIQDPIFINEHLLQSNCGILWRGPNNPNCAHFVQMDKSDIQITSNLKLPSSYYVLEATCNGLLLYSSNEVLVVMNPITRQELALPRFSSDIETHSSVGMAYAASSRVFKVIHMLYDKQCSSIHYEIISVGVDRAWRQVDTKPLSHLALEQLYWSTPYSAGESVHWTLLSISSTLTLDAETETFQLHPLPEGYKKIGKRFLVMGSSFSFMACASKFLWEVWLLAEKGTVLGWTKLADIDLEGDQRNMVEPNICPPGCDTVPIGWLKNREVLVFRVCPCRMTSDAAINFPIALAEAVPIESLNAFAYNVKTGKINSFKLEIMSLFQEFNSYLSTLMSPKGLL